MRLVIPLPAQAARKAFTLIELLISIGIIAVLAAIVIVAISPTKQIGDARNAQRRSDVNTILNAVYQYMLDHDGNPPEDVTTEDKEICKLTAVSCKNGISLRALSGSYIAGLPTDPTASISGTGTNYYMYRNSAGRIVVSAPNSEGGISISR